MTWLKITTYKSYAYMFRAYNQANLPCISSETFLSWQVHISGYIWESTFLYNRINFQPKVLHGISLYLIYPSFSYGFAKIQSKENPNFWRVQLLE